MKKIKAQSSKLKLKKGDKVKILIGKDSGKEGSVQFIRTSDNRIFVEGVNVYKRHVRKMEGIEGGIIDLPKSMNVSNVALICPNCKKITKIGFKLDGKTKVRICRKCKKEIK